ncbi:MAG: hypothetical protein NVS9B5_06330 [Terriglobales bacterium]
MGRKKNPANLLRSNGVGPATTKAAPSVAIFDGRESLRIVVRSLKSSVEFLLGIVQSFCVLV